MYHFTYDLISVKRSIRLKSKKLNWKVSFIFYFQWIQYCGYWSLEIMPAVCGSFQSRGISFATHAPTIGLTYCGINCDTPAAVFRDKLPDCGMRRKRKVKGTHVCRQRTDSTTGDSRPTGLGRLKELGTEVDTRSDAGASVYLSYEPKICDWIFLQINLKKKKNSVVEWINEFDV